MQVLGGGIGEESPHSFAVPVHEPDVVGANWMAVIGYTSASWTLKVDLGGTYLCRLLSFMDRQGFERVVPTLDADEGPTQTCFANIGSAGYVRRGEGAMPRQRLQGPWRNRDDYFADFKALRVRLVDDGALQFA